MKKIICVTLFLSFLSFIFSSLICAEEAKQIKSQFIRLSYGENFREIEIRGGEAFNDALVTALVQSPHFILETGEGDRVIHGSISRLEGVFIAHVIVTDFSSQEVLAAASAEFLSFSQYGFAVELLVAQLEGREVAKLYTERAVDTPIPFEPPDISLVTGSDESVFRMEEMLLESLNRGNTLYDFGEYSAAAEIFSEFITRYDTRLSEEYHDLFLPIREYALRRWELCRSLSLFSQAGDKAKEESYEEALALYISARDFISKLGEERDPSLESLLLLATEAVNLLDPICHTLLLAREGEFIFRINFFGFNDDEQGLVQAFRGFYSYASASRYSYLVQNNYNRKREFFNRSIPLDKVPMFPVFIEGGEFLMGSEGHESDEQPVRRVRIDSYYMESFELTFAEYSLFCTETKRALPLEEFQGINSYPMTDISWYDAVEYCNWRSSQEGLEPCYEIRKDIEDPSNHNFNDNLKWTVRWNRSANGYRLPTEAEWEYAARGGLSSKQTLYSGSDFLDEVSWYMNTSGGRAQPVGGKLPNELLLYDMSGNVWEYCWDWYAQETYDSGDEDNPSGGDGGTKKIVRGGSWENPSKYCRSTARNWTDPVFTSPRLGVRLVRNAE